MDKEQLLQEYKKVYESKGDRLIDESTLQEFGLAIDANLPEELLIFMMDNKLFNEEIKLVRLCYERNISQQEIETLLNKGFYYRQLIEINTGLEHNLTMDQIKGYLSKDKEAQELMLDRLIVEGKLTKDYKKQILNSDLDEYQIFQIGYGIDNGLSLDDIKIYASMKYSWEQMDEIRNLLEYNQTAKTKLTEEQFKFITNPDLEWHEMKLIRICYEYNVPKKEIKDLLNKDFEWGQVNQIYYGLKNGLSLNDIKIYASPEYEWSQMEEIRLALEHNLTEEQIEFISDWNLIDYEMKLARVCFEKGFNEFEVDCLLNNLYYYWVQHGDIAESIIEDFTADQIALFTIPGLEIKQMEEIHLGLKHGLPVDKVKIYANPEYESGKMEEIRLGLEHKLTLNQINFLRSIKPRTIGNLIDSDSEIKIARLCYENNVSQNEIDELLNKKLNYEQMREVIKGLEKGLTIDAIKIYASPEYSSQKMEQIRLLLEYDKTAEIKLTEDQINFIANPALKDYEMNFIRLCYEHNIPQNEIEELLAKEFDYRQFYEINKGLEHGLTLDEVKTYADLEYAHYQMEYKREQLEKEHEQNKQFEEIVNPKIKSIEQNDVIEQKSLEDDIKDNPADEPSLTTDDGLNKDNPDGDEQGL